MKIQNLFILIYVYLAVIIMKNEECNLFGHWLVDDSDVCVKCNNKIDLENDSYERIEIVIK